MTQRTYGILLLSFSKHSHQRSFVPLYQAHPRIRIVAVADEPEIDPYLKNWNRSAADELDVPYIESVDDALSRPDIDIVSIGHEIERRSELIIRCAGAGKHVWIDKFLGATIEECDMVVDQIGRSGVKTIVPGYTYGELVETSLALINSGTLGNLLGVHADLMFGKGNPREITDADRNTPFLPAGQWKFQDIKRELLTIGAYAVGLVQRCIGPIKHIWGQGDAYFFPEHAAHGADDFGTLSMADTHGRIATISGSRTGVASHNSGGMNNAFLVGTSGTARVDSNRPSIDTFIRDEIINADYRVPPDDPMQWASRAPVQCVGLSTNPLANGLDDLVDAIDKDRPTRYTVEDAREHMEILLAGYQSIVTGEIVSLPLQRERAQ